MVNFTYSCLYAFENCYATPKQLLTLENVNVNPKNGLAYKKVCILKQLLWNTGNYRNKVKHWYEMS